MTPSMYELASARMWFRHWFQACMQYILWQYKSSGAVRGCGSGTGSKPAVHRIQAVVQYRSSGAVTGRMHPCTARDGGTQVIEARPREPGERGEERLKPQHIPLAHTCPHYTPSPPPASHVEGSQGLPVLAQPQAECEEHACSAVLEGLGQEGGVAQVPGGREVERRGRTLCTEQCIIIEQHCSICSR